MHRILHRISVDVLFRSYYSEFSSEDFRSTCMKGAVNYHTLMIHWNKRNS